jgi:hypothetical protein
MGPVFYIKIQFSPANPAGHVVQGTAGPFAHKKIMNDPILFVNPESMSLSGKVKNRPHCAGIL